MGKLLKYSLSSGIMNVNITYGNETFKFNLIQESKIDRDVINKEITEQPSIYGFLTMLQTRIFNEMNFTERLMEKTYSKIYNKYKEEVNPQTGRIYDKEYVEQLVISNKEFQLKRREFLELKADYNIITVCVKTFEQRANLIQTLSANIRKES